MRISGFANPFTGSWPPMVMWGREDLISAGSGRICACEAVEVPHSAEVNSGNCQTVGWASPCATACSFASASVTIIVPEVEIFQS